MNEKICYDKAFVNRGNLSRIKKCMDKAKDGEKITIGFIGGSITQGSVATKEENCYAYLVYEWWVNKFPNSKFHYCNAGIGATDSQFACARVKEDLLIQEPDFVIIEFSVNDECNSHFCETYEGLVRTVLQSKKQPGILLVHNLFYDNGSNSEEIHRKIGSYYNLPSVSIKSALYPAIQSGELKRETITPDNLHPNDLGHSLVASVITDTLEQIASDAADETEEMNSNMLPAAITKNRYETNVRYRNHNADVLLDGFVKDLSMQESIRDIFKNGWTAKNKGDKITFRVNAGCLAVQYRRTICLPAPIARVLVDGKSVAILDGNFDETWGDKLVLQTVLEEDTPAEHVVEIELIETHETDKLPFYLVSLIASNLEAEEYPEILPLTPYFSHVLWGGNRLRTEFGYPEEGDDIGECWGISAHPNGESVISNGIYEGKKLSEVWKENPVLFGVETDKKFPLLTKIIDAKQDLSIQVHPSDAYALIHENGSLGKTECWYIISAKPDATLVIGHNAKTKNELIEMIKDGRYTELIREIPVKAGDFIQIEPGTVHAIKGGIMLLETQQNSDITYRVYDYDRLQNGKKRPLHVEQSIDVITVPAQDTKDSVFNVNGMPKNEINKLYSCKYYNVYCADITKEITFKRFAPFLLASVIEGDGCLNGLSIKKGDHFIITNCAEQIKVEGTCKLILSTI